MTKIRCGETVGIDLDEIIGWTLVPQECCELERLIIYFSGQFVTATREEVGDQAFDRLHRLLLDRFAIDLAPEQKSRGFKK